MSTPHKIGVLVAIPIKGRKLVNRIGGKQSPYVQLKLGDQKKRTKASLVASVEPEWDQEASSQWIILEFNTAWSKAPGSNPRFFLSF